MMKMHETTREAAALSAAAKAVIYELLGERIESAGLTGVIVDNETPPSYGGYIHLAGKLKFRVEKAIIILAVMVWSKVTLGSDGKEPEPPKLEELIFNTLGGFEGYRNLLPVPKDIGLCAAALSIREMLLAEPRNHYPRELAENHIRFLIRQTMVLLHQPPVPEAVKAIVKALTDKPALSGGEIHQICSKIENFEEIAVHGLIYAGPEFRRTDLK